MRAVVQRVDGCTVTVDERTVGAIGVGLLVYLGVGRGDSAADVRPMAEKIVNLRIFPDEDGRMNRSVLDVGGSVLVVSQFTLYGDTRGGRRPSYTEAAEPALARNLYEEVGRAIAAAGVPVATGEFAAHMRVAYVNVGPITILVDSEKKF